MTATARTVERKPCHPLAGHVRLAEPDLAAWNAADNAGYRIRTDVNRAGRGDTQSMPITIYTIGYLGSGGLDDGLLKRISNDTTSSSYDASQGTGVYIPAADQAQLDAAFNKVSGMILRLSR